MFAQDSHPLILVRLILPTGLILTNIYQLSCLNTKLLAEQL